MNTLNKLFRFQVPILRHIPRSISYVVSQKELCTYNQNPATSNILSLPHKYKFPWFYSGLKLLHTKGERELVEFLAEEIVAEKKAQKSKTLPTEIDGFKIKLNSADVELTKQTENESIVISFNVNHTVDAENEAEIDGNKPEFSEIRSRPQFEVDIIRGSHTLSFTCSFLQNESQEDDVFGIDEITIYEGKWNNTMYAVAGDVLDGYLYDLLMNLLEEKGISNEFAEKLSDFSTAYEHSAYISLLEGISQFTINKN